MSGISHDEWLAALEELRPGKTDDPNAISAHEFAKLMGMGIKRARVTLNQLVDTGKARRTTKWLRRPSDGQMVQIPAYVLIKPQRTAPLRKKAS